MVNNSGAWNYEQNKKQTKTVISCIYIYFK